MEQREKTDPDVKRFVDKSGIVEPVRRQVKQQEGAGEKDINAGHQFSQLHARDNGAIEQYGPRANEKIE
jgi:hypothetical protein